MRRPITCMVGIHTWQTVDYDHNSDRITLECRKCGTQRVKDPAQRPDLPEPPRGDFR
jgi:hypothetical protein